jgi:hypothetical protein
MVLPNVLMLFYSKNMTKVTLWENRAFEFSYESIYDSPKQDSIVVLFIVMGISLCT